MPKPNKPIKIQVMNLGCALQPDQWPERTQKIIGAAIGRMLMREKAHLEQEDVRKTGSQAEEGQKSAQAQ
jgi:hypothetical protein